MYEKKLKPRSFEDVLAHILEMNKNKKVEIKELIKKGIETGEFDDLWLADEAIKWGDGDYAP